MVPEAPATSYISSGLSTFAHMKWYIIPALLIFSGPATFAQSKLQQFDDRVLEDLAAHRTPGQTRMWHTISNMNDYVDVGIPVVVLTAGLIKNDPDMKQNALYIASSTASTFLLNTLIKVIVKRPRPFVSNVRLKAVYEPTSYSFPSGHTSSAFSATTALSRAYPRWYIIAPSMLWASAIGYSRMYLGVHYPTDVATGALLGAGVPFALGFIRPDRH